MAGSCCRIGRCRWPWSAARTARNFWVFVVIVAFCALPALVWELVQRKEENHVIAWFVAGVFALLAIPISIGEVALHLTYYNRPKVQKYVIRIIWMVPIYALDSWLALRFSHAALLLDTIRECYEAYVIYNFFFFLQASLGEEREINERLSERAPVPHMFPFNCCMRPWRMDGQFLSRCKHGVLSYTVIKLLLTIISIILQLTDKYHEGDLSPTHGYLWIALINNNSQIWAMYCLVLFYKVNAVELAPIRPVAKLLCVKSVVFFSFWQSIAIAILVKAEVIKGDPSWQVYTVESVSTGLQEFAICIEMFFASLAHLYAFSHREYKVHGEVNQRWTEMIGHMFDVADVKENIADHVGVVAQTMGGGVQTAVKGVAKGVVGGVVGVAGGVTKVAKAVVRPFKGRNGDTRDGVSPGGLSSSKDGISPNGSSEGRSISPTAASSQEYEPLSSIEPVSMASPRRPHHNSNSDSLASTPASVPPVVSSSSTTLTVGVGGSVTTINVPINSNHHSHHGRRDFDDNDDHKLLHDSNSIDDQMDDMTDINNDHTLVPLVGVNERHRGSD